MSIIPTLNLKNAHTGPNCMTVTYCKMEANTDSTFFLEALTTNLQVIGGGLQITTIDTILYNIYSSFESTEIGANVCKYTLERCLVKVRLPFYLGR